MLLLQNCKCGGVSYFKVTLLVSPLKYGNERNLLMTDNALVKKLTVAY